MATMTFEISDVSKAFMDREIASGRFKDPNSLVQTALEQLMRTQRKENAELELVEAIEEYDRGEFTPWQKGDCEKVGRQYLQEKRAREAKL